MYDHQNHFVFFTLDWVFDITCTLVADPLSGNPPIASPCFCSSPERINQTLTLKRAFHIFCEFHSYCRLFCMFRRGGWVDNSMGSRDDKIYHNKSLNVALAESAVWIICVTLSSFVCLSLSLSLETFGCRVTPFITLSLLLSISLLFFYIFRTITDICIHHPL